MDISLPHTITGGTTPIADEVQGNFAALLGAMNGIQVIGASADTKVTRTVLSGIGTTSGDLSDTDVEFTVADDSMVLLNLSGYVWAAVKSGSFVATLSLKLDGTPVHSGIYSADWKLGSPLDEVTHFVPITVVGKPIALTAGTHTIAAHASVNVTRAMGTLQTNAVEAGWVSWNGLVVPAWE